MCIAHGLWHFYPRPPGGGRQGLISYPGLIKDYFYPRPPGGGRLAPRRMLIPLTADFYPRPPGGGRQAIMDGTKMVRVDFYPRPPGGGRQGKSTMARPQKDFYPRPPGGGRQQKRTKFSSVFAQKGEEFASLRHGKRKICRWRFKKDKFWGLIWCEGSGKSVYALASHCG